MVLDHVVIDIATAADSFGPKADPVLLSVATVRAGGPDGHVFELFDGKNELTGDAVGALFDRLDGEEAHDGSFFRLVGGGICAHFFLIFGNLGRILFISYLLIFCFLLFFVFIDSKRGHLSCQILGLFGIVFLIGVFFALL